MKRKKNPAIILLLQWILFTRNLFLLLLIISGCLLLLSIYFITIYGIPGPTNTIDNYHLDGTKLERFRARHNSDMTLRDNRMSGRITNSKENQWWQWLRPYISAQYNLNNHSWNDDNSQRKISKYFTNKLPAEKVIVKQVHQLAFNAQRRSQLIKFRFNALLNTIKIQKQNQQMNCSHLGGIHFPATSIISKLDIQTKWINLTRTLSNLNQCDIVVINKMNDYKELLKTNKELVEYWNSRIFRDYFEELDLVLQMPDLRCNLFDHVRKYSALRQQPLSPLCFILPQNLQQFLDVSDALGYSTNWTLEYGTEGNRISEPLQVFSQKDRSHLIQINRLALRQHLISSSKSMRPILIKQHLIQQVVHHQKQPIKMRIFVLITSLNPLRALQYKHGMVFPYNQNNSQQGNFKIDTIENLWKSMENRYPPEQLSQAQNSVHQVLLYTLILLEIGNRVLNLPIETNNSFPPELQSFQWLAFDIIIQHTETFQAFVVDILLPERLLYEKNQQEVQMKLLYQLKMDTYRLLSRSFTVSYENSFKRVRGKLEPLLIEKDNIGLLSINCHISHLICLSQTDLIYILDTVHQFEQIEQSSFQLIYPYEWYTHLNNNNWELNNIRALFEQILLKMDNNEDEKQPRNNFEYQTERLHSVFEIIFSHMSSINDLKEQFSMIGEHRELTNLNWTGPLVIDDNQSLVRTCSKNPYSLSHLRKLEIIYPKIIEIKPKFNPYLLHYVANQSVDYHKMLIQIQVEVAHCDTWIQLDNHFYNLQSGKLNFSLGIGDNNIHLTLINKKISEGNMVLAVYTIMIHRMSREEQYPLSKVTFKYDHYHICSMIQDCDLKIYSTLTCGWQSTIKTCSQNQLLEKNCSFEEDEEEHSKHICPTGAEDGRWLVPCHRCDQENTCLWAKLKWLPYRCRYSIPVETNHLIQCLSNKNILLIGDSTNRGIMHYILERLNRTLTEADKTHDYKTYHLVDFGTTISFAYYPKFWLPTLERPSFAQVFSQSLKTFLIENTTDNIIIIGGVQWISRQHLQIAHKELKTQNLDNRIRLIVKTIGSGFHQSVIGVHYMPLSDQIRLASKNQLLINEALRLNIEVIDTFNKTIAMFKDFYPGKCACHFHKITKEMANNITISFHVEGQLNQLYSEILLSKICT